MRRADLLVWSNCDGAAKLYLLPTGSLKPYASVHGHLMDETGLTQDQENRIEHLAYMIGDENYYGTIVPTLEDFLAQAKQVEIQGNLGKPCPAPWEQYKVVTDFTNVPVEFDNIVSTGWM